MGEKKRVTIDELEVILEEGTEDIEILPSGEISVSPKMACPACTEKDERIAELEAALTAYGEADELYVKWGKSPTWAGRPFERLDAAMEKARALREALT